MTDKAGDTDAGMAALRPLSACVAGAGIMTLGVLQFLGQVWSAVPDAARLEMLITVRVAFLGFLVTLAALVLAWLGQRIAGPVLRGAITLFGLVVFAASAFSVALGIGRALSKAAPLTNDALPPDGVLAFMGAELVALVLLAAALAIMALRGLLRREEP
jgi:hypothetical protein